VKITESNGMNDVSIPRLYLLRFGMSFRRENPRRAGLDKGYFVWQSECGMTTPMMLKKPSAWLPIGMSLAAVSVVCIHIALHGTARQADEGTAAHLWQLLMAAQIPSIAFFMIRWLPESPKQTLTILALQMVAALTALAPVYLLRW